METPKPGPFKSQSDEQHSNLPETTKDEKKPFVRKPHLTSKPFRDHEGLRQLQAQMNKSTSDKGAKPYNGQPNRRDNKRIDPKAKRQR